MKATERRSHGATEGGGRRPVRISRSQLTTGLRPRAERCDRVPLCPSSLLRSFASSLLFLPAALPARAGSIEATVQSDVRIVSVSAVGRRASAIGVYPEPISGRMVEGRMVFQDVPPGRYDLRFDTPEGIVHGWDAGVPESDYVQEQPLDPQSRRRIAEKLARMHRRQFFDQVVLLDISGNVQHAAVLLSQVRRRAFVGGGYEAGELVWRVDRWEYENPQEHTWVPVQERPFYALFRERLGEKDLGAKRITFARHLGGIEVRADGSDVDLGIILVPSPKPGIHAVNPDGSAADPIQLKPDRVDEYFSRFEQDGGDRDSE